MMNKPPFICLRKLISGDLVMKYRLNVYQDQWREDLLIIFAINMNTNENNKNVRNRKKQFKNTWL